MAAPPQERVRKRLVWFSPVLLAVALTPVFLQTQYTCERPGNTRLSSLEFEVLNVNRIAFDPALRVYDVWLPAGATTVTVRVQTADPAAHTTWYVQDAGGVGVSGILGVGGGEVTLDLPPDGHLLGVGVYPTGGAIGKYTVNVNPPCPQGDPCQNGGVPGTCIAGVCEADASCPVLTSVSAAPLQANVGDEINVSAEASDEQEDMIDYLWSGSGGVFADPSAASTTYTCLEIGPQDINIAVSDDDFTNCIADWTLTIECLPMCTDDVDCDDGNDCTVDVCDPANGSCTNDPLPDGTSCGVDGVCDAGACRERSWGTPVLVETDDVPYAWYAKVAIDANGNAIALWVQSDGVQGSIWSNRFTPGSGWGTAEQLDADARSPQVAFGPLGVGVAVWSGSGFGYGFGIWSNRFTPGSGWGAAELLGSGWGTDHAQLAIDTDGNVVTVWQQYDGVQTSIWSNRFTPGNGWGTAELLETDNAADLRNPQVAIDPNGNALAVWQEYSGSPNNIWSNRFTLGSGWGTAELIETGNTNDARYPQVAIDPSGNALAVWEETDRTPSGFGSNRFTPGSGWGTAEVVETLGRAQHAQVAIDPNGNAVAVWSQQGATLFSIWSNRFTPGSGWGTAELIETDNEGSATDPHVAIDPNGNAIAVWWQWWLQDGAYQGRIWSNRFTPGSGWGMAEKLDAEHADEARNARVAIDPNGNALAVWHQFDGTRYSVWSNRFE